MGSNRIVIDCKYGDQTPYDVFLNETICQLFKDRSR